MKVDKQFQWEPDFRNQIIIEQDEFQITINKEQVEIMHDWDDGYLSRGSHVIYLPLAELKKLIEELEKS